jgi:glycosyltransferase involved in cell wall biosynthesis
MEKQGSLMKVVVVTGLAKTLVWFRIPLLKAMLEAGHEVVALGAEDDKSVAQTLGEIGVPYHPLHMDRTGLSPLKDLTLFLKLWRFFRQARPDSFLGYTVKAVVYGTLAAALAGVPKRYAMVAGLGYAFTSRSLKGRISNLVVRFLYKISLSLCAAVFFQNPDDRQTFIDLKLVPAEKTVLVNGSGVDLDYFASMPVPEGKMVFLLIARLLREKGIVEYVEAARLVKQKYPETVFRLLGPFDVNPTVLSEEQISAWHKEGIIEYLDEVKDVRPHIAQASVFVLPSYYGEGVPHSILEAMSMGRPIITTDWPGCRETVTDGENGVLIPVRDVDALAQAMEKLIEEPFIVMEMGMRSRILAEEKFDVHKVNRILMHNMGLIS